MSYFSRSYLDFANDKITSPYKYKNAQELTILECEYQINLLEEYQLNPFCGLAMIHPLVQ